MLDLVVGTKTKAAATDTLVAELRSLESGASTLYVGYPILSGADYTATVDALLTSERFGVVIFDLISTPVQADRAAWEAIEERQTRLVLSLKSRLVQHRSLCVRRDQSFGTRLRRLFRLTPRG